MTLDYNKPGKVKTDMTKYIQTNILDDLPDILNGTAVTPAANHLFEINEDFKNLDKSTAELFHHIVAQLLFWENMVALISLQQWHSQPLGSKNLTKTILEN